MAYIQVDVDMDEFETYELVEEVCKRMRKMAGRRALSDKDKKDLKESFEELKKSFDLTPENSIEVKTLDDKIKYEHLLNIWGKYTSADIERLLP